MSEPFFFGAAKVLIPQSDLSRWSVNACDQYTSQPSYWDQVDALTVDQPSAVHMMLPEARLNTTEEEVSRMIAGINAKMKEYLASDLFRTYENAYIYVERVQSDGRTRKGLIGLIDLEQYDYHTGASSYIRATEQTVLERIPPRVAIRKDAVMEMPHLMLLADDPEYRLIEPLSAQKEHFEKIYDFKLMMNGGSISGYLLDAAAAENVAQVLAEFSSETYFRARYQTSEPVLTLAVGDGNHSLASAKECYERNKKKMGDAALHHPSRYAMAEIVNLHDSALEFEPIYRLLMHADLDDLLNYFRAKKPQVHAGAAKPGEVSFYFQSELERRTFSLASDGQLPVQILQPVLDAYLKEHPEVKIDYVHGLDAVRGLAKTPGNIAITFEGMQKSNLFSSIVHGGVLPRKTFSMGCADDKRFYLECREIQ